MRNVEGRFIGFTGVRELRIEDDGVEVRKVEQVVRGTIPNPIQFSTSNLQQREIGRLTPARLKRPHFACRRTLPQG